MSNTLADAFRPRRTSRHIRCEVCGENEGECIPELHHIHDEEEREKARAAEESERRIADMVAAKLAAAPSAVEPPALIDAEEAARLKGISVGALYQRKARGQLPSGSVVQTGRRVQFHREKLLAGLERKAR